MRIIVFLTILGAALAVPAYNAPRIVGGSETTIESYPFVANIQYSFFGVTWYLICGGTLITPRSVLTTGHCLFWPITEMFRVRVGTSYAAGGGDEYILTDIIIHAEFDNDTFMADVAVLIMERSATLSSTVAIGSIAGPNYQLPDGTSVTAVGWGRIESEGAFPDQLRHVELSIINQEICAQRYADLKTQPGFQHFPDVTSSMICTGILNVEGFGTCESDNGGPILHNNIVIGLIGWRYGCGMALYPGVNTRVSSYTDWIVANGSV